MIRFLFALSAFVFIGVFPVYAFGFNSNDLKIGEKLEFGAYYWIVLAIRDEGVLIISDRIVSRNSFEQTDEFSTWETSYIRHWLNDDFYNSFSPFDRSRILALEIANDDNIWFGTGAGQDTTDKIFLLSIEEALQYLGGGVRGDIVDEYTGLVGIWDERSCERIAHYTDGEARWWWLRSPGQHDNFSANVSPNGTVNIQGVTVTNRGGGVRPALWLRLSP